MSKALQIDLADGRLRQLDVLQPSNTSLTAAANKIPVAGEDGLLDASWGVTSGTPAGSVDDQIRGVLALNNTDPIDQKITAGDYIVLIFFGSHNANSWKAATGAVHTVSTGKKLIIIEARVATVMADTSNRRMRLWNVTDSTQLADYTSFVYSGFFWFGDVSAPSALGVVAAGKQIRLEMWNSDINKRAMGAMLICREVAE